MKKKKIPKSVIASGILGVLCVCVYIILDLYVLSKPQKVEYPPAGVNDSIFELQNMSYEAVGGFRDTITLEGVPLKVDAAPGVEANVGGVTIRENSGYYFLYAVADPDKTTEKLLGDSLTGILSPSADSSKTTAVPLDAEDGNLHGCHASYRLFELAAEDGTESWIALYRLHVDETFGEIDKDIILGCMSGTYSTEGLANLQRFAGAMVGTLRMDDKENGR